jgi:UDPglucose 6-dehydrogenase
MLQIQCLPLKIINDIANLCEIVGADINKVRKGIDLTLVLVTNLYIQVLIWWFLFPKRRSSINSTASEHNYELRVSKAVEAVNNDQK